MTLCYLVKTIIEKRRFNRFDQGFSRQKAIRFDDPKKKINMYKLRQSTEKRNGHRGRFPEYAANRGKAIYEMNSSRSQAL